MTRCFSRYSGPTLPTNFKNSNPISSCSFLTIEKGKIDSINLWTFSFPPNFHDANLSTKPQYFLAKISINPGHEGCAISTLNVYDNETLSFDVLQFKHPSLSNNPAA